MLSFCHNKAGATFVGIITSLGHQMFIPIYDLEWTKVTQYPAQDGLAICCIFFVHYY